MQAFSVSYRFTQRFPVPAQEAFDWATDYQPNDLALMGEEGKRTIQKITEDAIILKEDITHARGKTSKVKLVRLNPRSPLLAQYPHPRTQQILRIPLRNNSRRQRKIKTHFYRTIGIVQQGSAKLPKTQTDSQQGETLRFQSLETSSKRNGERTSQKNEAKLIDQ